MGLNKGFGELGGRARLVSVFIAVTLLPRRLHRLSFWLQMSSDSNL